MKNLVVRRVSDAPQERRDALAQLRHTAWVHGLDFDERDITEQWAGAVYVFVVPGDALRPSREGTR